VSELELHRWMVGAQFALAAPTTLALLFVAAPYGRYERPGWGPMVPARVGWVLMELPAVVLFGALFFAGDHRFELVPLVLLSLWQLHYLHRTFVYPLRMRETGRRMPVLIVILALAFNTLNSTLNARWIGHLGTYEPTWLADPRFVLGALLFLAGWLGNLHSDGILRNLRRPGEVGYAIPRDGLYRWVSTPNYLCEIVEWTGWAVATWSLAGLAFTVYTAANLAPRARSHHAWYRARFPDYPKERRVLVPQVW
jgi:protein-S-isoprenylcysteine O-methyltransferase Ste14